MNKISKIIWSLFSGAVCLVYKSENANAHNMTNPTYCQVYYGTSTCGDPNNASSPVFGQYFGPGANCTSTAGIRCMRTASSSDFTYEECTACKQPYTLVTGNVLGNTNVCGSSKTFYQKTCQCICSNCTNTGSWSAYGTGYEKYSGQGCDCSGSTATCKTVTEYRCAANYYGTTSNGTSGCTPCPSSGKSLAGSSSISSCYIPEGTYSDTTGKYAMNCDCPYAGRDNCGSSSSSA